MLATRPPTTSQWSNSLAQHLLDTLCKKHFPALKTLAV